MKIIKEQIFDVHTIANHEITYTDTGGILDIDCTHCTNKLFFLCDYEEPFNNRDFIWITDDMKVIEVDDSLLNIISDNDEFIQKMRDLKTEERIVDWINFIML